MLIEGKELTSWLEQYGSFDSDPAKEVFEKAKLTEIVSKDPIVLLAQAACWMEALGCKQNIGKAERILLAAPFQVKSLADPLRAKLIEIFTNLANASKGSEKRNYCARAHTLSLICYPVEPVVTSSGYGSRAMR